MASKGTEISSKFILRWLLSDNRDSERTDYSPVIGSSPRLWQGDLTHLYDPRDLDRLSIVQFNKRLRTHYSTGAWKGSHERLETWSSRTLYVPCVAVSINTRIEIKDRGYVRTRPKNKDPLYLSLPHKRNVQVALIPIRILGNRLARR